MSNILYIRDRGHQIRSSILRAGKKEMAGSYCLGISNLRNFHKIPFPEKVFRLSRHRYNENPAIWQRRGEKRSVCRNLRFFPDFLDRLFFPEGGNEGRGEVRTIKSRHDCRISDLHLQQVSFWAFDMPSEADVESFVAKLTFFCLIT